MTMLESTISMLEILPEADLVEIQNVAKKLLQKRNAVCPFVLKNKEDIYRDLDASRQQIAKGDYQVAKEFSAEVRKEYGI